MIAKLIFSDHVKPVWYKGGIIMKSVHALFPVFFILMLSMFTVKDIIAHDIKSPIIILNAQTATLTTSAQLKLEQNEGIYNIGYWTGTADEISWDMVVYKAGEYEVTAEVSCDMQYSGSTVGITVDTQTLTFSIPDTGTWYSYKDMVIDRLYLNAGTHKVSVKALKVNKQYIGNLKLLMFDSRFQSTLNLNTPKKQREYASEILKDRFIWMMYDALFNEKELSNALSYNAEVLIRGYFKWGPWGKISNWVPPAHYIRDVQMKGILFGAGGTFSALYPGEVDKATFEKFVDRNPYNKPEYFQHNSGIDYYHGNIQQKEYLDYILTWIFAQIDAGIDTFFMDEVGGSGSWHTGYTDTGMTAFTGYLMTKYIDGQGWKKNDVRWKTRLDIDLKTDCTDQTIKTFDYRKYLARKGYQDAPYMYDFPLKTEWGDPWDYLFTESYIKQRNQKSWKYIMDAVREYSAKKGRYVLVAANGLNEYVDYQIEGVWNNWKVDNGKLDISPCYIDTWRRKLAASNELLGFEVPLLIFHDWGFTMPFFTEIEDDDRILWLRVYVPEVFASGALFIWPVLNCGTEYRPSALLDNTMRNLMTWYDENRSLYQNAEWAGNSLVDMKKTTQVVSAVTDITSGNVNRRIVHLINKKLGKERNLVPRNNFTISLPSEKQPESVFAVSPDVEGETALTYSWNNGNADIIVKNLQAYTVIVLDYIQM
jgi:hypothetical protein